MTMEEIRKHGLEALARELGPVGTVRFLGQFETGSGGYSTERHQRLPGKNSQHRRKRQSGMEKRRRKTKE